MMSTDFSQYLEPPIYTFNEGLVDSLQNQTSGMISADGIMSRPRECADLLGTIVRVAHNAVTEQSYSLKPSVMLNGVEYKIPANCTDVASAILQLTSTLGLQAYGQFNGWHASVVVPADESACWDVDDYVRPRLRYLKTELLGDIWPGEVVPNPKTISNNSGILYLKRLQSRQLSSYSIFGYDLLGETTAILERHQPLESAERNFIVVNNEVAQPMFRALDLLNTLKTHAGSDESLRPVVEKAKDEVKTYIPRLKPRASDKVQ